MKRLAIGVSDFKKIIEGDFYYFDKTNLLGLANNFTSEPSFIISSINFVLSK